MSEFTFREIETLSLAVSHKLAAPPKRAATPAAKIRLFVQVYKATTPERQKELDLCLERNKANKYIEVVEIAVQDRLSFGKFFAVAEQALATDEHRGETTDVVSILSNSDILYDETISLARWINPEDAWCLTRWSSNHKAPDGHDANGKNGESLGADAWIFRGRPKKGLTEVEFGMGISMCDYSIAARLKSAGYNVHNPCWTVRSWHVHSSEVRTYQDLPLTPLPHLILVPPSSLSSWCPPGMNIGQLQPKNLHLPDHSPTWPAGCIVSRFTVSRPSGGKYAHLEKKLDADPRLQKVDVVTWKIKGR